MSGLVQRTSGATNTESTSDPTLGSQQLPLPPPEPLPYLRPRSTRAPSIGYIYQAWILILPPEVLKYCFAWLGHVSDIVHYLSSCRKLFFELRIQCFGEGVLRVEGWDSLYWWGKIMPTPGPPARYQPQKSVYKFCQPPTPSLGTNHTK